MLISVYVSELSFLMHTVLVIIINILHPCFLYCVLNVCLLVISAILEAMFEGKLHMTMLRIDQVPEHFHELFIISGYRSPRSSATQCLVSMFQPTNETLNFWTHFIPGVYFCWVLWGMSYEVSFFSILHHVIQLS